MRVIWRRPCAQRLARSALRSLQRSGKHWEQSRHREAAPKLDRGTQGHRYAHTSRTHGLPLRGRTLFLFARLWDAGTTSTKGSRCTVATLRVGCPPIGNWGPFAVQASRVLHYFVYFAVGVCLGAFGTETEIFERRGRLARGWWFWCILAAVMFTVTIVCVRTRNGTGGRIGFAFSCAVSSLFVTALVIRFVRPWRWADSLSANAYGIYLAHYVFVVWIQYAALRWSTPAFVKGLAVSLAAVGMSWATVALMRRSKLIARVI
jgi:hypothetical protein